VNVYRDVAADDELRGPETDDHAVPKYRYLSVTTSSIEPIEARIRRQRQQPPSTSWLPR
jgi:hypothetical protein